MAAAAAYLMGDSNKRRKVEHSESMTYTAQRILGKGSFGVVYQAQVLETNEIVAIKSIRMQEQDREIQILKELDGHPNVVCLKGAFISNDGGVPGGAQDKRLNIVLEFLSDTLHRVIKHYNVVGHTMPHTYQALYLYQLLRALAFMHGKAIVHADIKPQNLLIDGANQCIKLCDFGTAKRLIPGEQLRAYMCSRYYRAPELILGSSVYNTSIDLWSAGAVFAEMILGQPLYTGKDGIHQLVEIVKVLGTPSANELRAMNSSYPHFEIQPCVASLPWSQVLRGRASPEACDIAGQLMRYDPSARCPPFPALKHAFFDPLRAEDKPIYRQLFNFRQDELLWLTAQEREQFVPAWYKALQAKSTANED